MRNQTFVLKIKAWDDGPAFVPVLKPRRQEAGIHPALSYEFSAEGQKPKQSLKPVGFYVAYSYTLFRKGDGPRDPLYALF